MFLFTVAPRLLLMAGMASSSHYEPPTANNVASQCPSTELVWVLLYGGNYKDMCCKLGQELYEDAAKTHQIYDLISQVPEQMQTEEGKALLKRILSDLVKFEQQLSPAQTELRVICQNMGYPNCTSRPPFAGGGNVFVNERVASIIHDTFEPGELRKGHIVVSPEFLCIVNEVMGAGTTQPKLRNQSSKLVSVPFVEDESSPPEGVAPDCPSPDAVSMQMLKELPEVCQHLENNGIYMKVRLVKVGQCPTVRTRLTQTTGEQPRILTTNASNIFKSWQPSRKNFKLTGKLAELKQIHGDDSAQGYQSSATESGNNSGGGGGGGGNADSNGDDHERDEDECDASNMQGAEKSDGSSGSNADWALFSELLMQRHGVDVSADVLNSIANACQDFYAEQIRSIQEVPNANVFSFEDFLKQTLSKKALPKVNNKAEFTKHVKDCVEAFVPQFLQPFLETLPLEDKLASATSETLLADDSMMKDCLQELADKARACACKESMLCILQHCDSKKSFQGMYVGDILQQVAETFKKTKRQQVVELKQRIRKSDIPDGAHAVAALLREMAVKAMSEAFDQIDTETMGECTWDEAKALAPPGIQSAKSSLSAGPRFSTVYYSDHAQMIEKEATRRANKYDKQVKGGRKKVITDAGRTGKNRVRQINLI